MKISKTRSSLRGFTLIELIVAMAITTIIVTVLVSITSIALDTWNRSRAELRASQQGKAAIDTIARDFESFVSRRGNTNEWLSAIVQTDLPGGKLKSTNASDLIFFTAATDRYNGNIGDPTKDKGGDVSCVGYKLNYKDPINPSGASQFETFVLNRYLVNPDETFKDLLGKDDLKTAFSAFSSQLDKPENFVCENVFQFSLTFHVQVTDSAQNPPVIKDVPVILGSTTSSFSVLGTGIVTVPADSLVATGRLTSVEISVTVISDFGIDQIRNRNFTQAQQADFLAKNSYEFSKLVQLPGM